MPIGSRDPYPSTHGRERSGSVVECLTSLETEGPRVLESLIGVIVLCLSARHIYPSLVLAQHRKNRPDVTKISLSGT